MGEVGFPVFFPGTSDDIVLREANLERRSAVDSLAAVEHDLKALMEEVFIEHQLTPQECSRDHECFPTPTAKVPGTSLDDSYTRNALGEYFGIEYTSLDVFFGMVNRHKPVTSSLDQKSLND
eukprot:5960092-Amphidinium_carterae.1